MSALRQSSAFRKFMSAGQSPRFCQNSRTMNCVNCGAPMALHATRPCWSCSHCVGLVCPEPADDGLRITNEHGHECPVCEQALTRATIDDRDPVEICQRCKGMLMARQAFAERLTARRRAARTPGIV